MTADDFLPAKTGVGVHTSQISLELVRRGHHVTAITARRPGQTAFEEWHGVRIHRTRSMKVKDFYVSVTGPSSIRDILRQERIEIVNHQYLGILADRSSRVARGLGLKQIYTFNSTIEHMLVSPVLKLFSRLIAAKALQFYNRCDLITFPARRLRDEETAHGGIRVPTVYVSNATGIDTAAVSPVKMPAKKFTILSVGRLHPEKNVSCLIRAFAALQSRIPGSELWIVGDGHLQKDLQREAESLGVGDGVKFHGRVSHEEVGSYYSRASVFAFPSWFETQGMVALEAMYYGLPVLVSRNLISAGDLVEDGKNGFLIDPASPADVVEKLLLLAKDPERATSMGSAGKKHFDQFRTGTVASAFEDLYYSLLGNS